MFFSSLTMVSNTLALIITYSSYFFFFLLPHPLHLLCTIISSRDIFELSKNYIPSFWIDILNMENFWWIILKSQINETMNKKVCRCFYGSGEVEHSIKTTLCLYCSGFPFFVLICSTIMHDERDVQTRVPGIWFKKIRTKKNWSSGYHLRVDLELTLLVSSNHIMSGIG